MKRKEFLSTLINENLSCKEENLSGIIKRINGDKKQKSVYSFNFRVVAVVAIIVILTTATVFAAIGGREAEFSIIANKKGVILKDDVIITATAENCKNFVEGIFGLSVDVNFNNEVFEFDKSFGEGIGITAGSSLGEGFKLMADLSDENTVTILIYSDDKSGELSFLDVSNSGAALNLFNLHFTVKSGLTAAQSSSFSFSNCKVVDEDTFGLNYELVENITLMETKLDFLPLNRGDLNQDKTVNILDLVRFKKYAVSGFENKLPAESLADVDGNGILEEAIDLVFLRKILLGII